ncbi:sulfite exporter TauE/SafE family protein [Rhizobium leguminosarum]|uniref:sulfite exporter TauE/SafE family protein n=1 Tax=Rhizobium leguminosarum TaxID=384 RepID=UPI001C948689|nr:sulfite exporter TauE/SafE family protein [Rhizobium leguminosarum]MBY5518678.1 sulfite exporter TauE/SafE family protein [Rhizobium leguminosarum]MBY5545706.1 sulfite exporter TauE/SafE family protein [Rhizobium leguminosarum]MBY5808714.1 sulfite exporter TauE/SafE family protein [Rhizobium leguminosarum]
MTSDFFFFIVVGFCAQIVDGALGMAFGVLSTTSLLAFGVPAANASAMTHVAEMFTTAASGLSHAYHRNVDWRLVARLAPAGMIGGAIGAYLLSNIDGKVIEPFVSAYLIAIGLVILYKAFRPPPKRDVRDWMVPPVGLFGGVLDAIGGGGWGPIVTSSLVSRGHDLKRVIGSTNFTEFAVTLTISLTFILTLGWSELDSAIGLIIGGVIAAPFGAIVVKRLPVQPLMVAVSMIIIGTSAMRLL